MLRFKHQNFIKLSLQTRYFSSVSEPQKIRKPVPTPEAGYRLPKEKEGQELIGHRVAGDTNIFAKPANFNFNLRREKEQKTRHRLIGLAVLLSFAPVVYMIFNAEHMFRKTGVKEISKHRRERLDAEHGIDRPEMK